jgi:hypothetical protein
MKTLDRLPWRHFCNALLKYYVITDKDLSF